MDKIIIKAKEMGVLISFDFNYRGKLWTLDEAAPILTSYLSYIDICFAGNFDAKNIMRLGFEGTLEEYYREILKRYPNIKYLLSTKRETHLVDENSLTGFIYKDGKLLSSMTYRFTIVDRVGGGDAFAAGALYGIYNRLNPQKIVDFATAASVYKHTIRGDANIASIEEISDILNKNILSVRR